MRTPTKNLEEYQGSERDAQFVRRYDDRLWAYCAMRFQRRWAGQGRQIPQGVQHEGETGWWFPRIWIVDFVDEHGGELRNERPKRNDERRERQVTAAHRTGLTRRFPKVAEMATWGLPVGTHLLANQTVRYPDGSAESFDEIRRRIGRAPRDTRSDEQQNLEAMLTMLHAKADVEPSEALMAHPLTRRNLGREAAE